MRGSPEQERAAGARSGTVRPLDMRLGRVLVYVAWAWRRMAITGIHHFNLRVSATELDTLQRFYCDVVGLSVGLCPSVRSAGVWLYTGGTPLIQSDLDAQR